MRKRRNLEALRSANGGHLRCQCNLLTTAIQSEQRICRYDPEADIDAAELRLLEDQRNLLVKYPACLEEPAAAAGGTEAPPDLARGVDGELHFPPAAAVDEHGAGGAAGAQAADTSPRVQEPAAAAGGTEAPPDLARGEDGELHFPPTAAADEHGAGGAAGAQAGDTSPRVQEPAAAAGGTEAPPDLARGVDGELHFPPAAAADEHGAGGAAGAQAADTSPRVQAQPEGRRARATTRSQAAAAPLPLRPKPASRSRGRSRLGTAGGRLPSSPAAVAGDAVASE
ncbi:hypothetical protein PLESTM_000921600, partial [Pleodorina starrii]